MISPRTDHFGARTNEIHHDLVINGNCPNVSAIDSIKLVLDLSNLSSKRCLEALKRGLLKWIQIEKLYIHIYTHVLKCFLYDVYFLAIENILSRNNKGKKLFLKTFMYQNTPYNSGW